MIGRRMKRRYEYEAGAVLLGGLLGAGVALMTAPWSGREAREKIGDFADGVKGRAECYGGMAKEKMNSAVHHGKDFFRRKRQIMAKSFDAGREAYRNEKKRLTGSR